MKILLSILVLFSLSACSSPGEKRTVFEEYMLNRALAPKIYIPAPQYQNYRPNYTTTTCTKNGNFINCDSF